jgi:hypothetical protein
MVPDQRTIGQLKVSAKGVVIPIFKTAALVYHGNTEYIFIIIIPGVT